MITATCNTCGKTIAFDARPTPLGSKGWVIRWEHDTPIWGACRDCQQKRLEKKYAKAKEQDDE